MRRLIALIASLMFLELVFFGVLSPMLPGLKREFGLSTSETGVLVATYAIGSVLGAAPAVMLAARVGVRTTALASLLALALSSLLFGWGTSYAVLLTARLAQGIAGAACFTAAMVWLLEVAPPERRGVLVGLAFGISEAGSIAAPVIGGGAATIGRDVAFSMPTMTTSDLCTAGTRSAWRLPRRPSYSRSC